MYDNFKNKIYTLLISIFVLIIVLIIYFIDARDFDSVKIISCVFFSTYAFFIVPTIRRFYINNKNLSFEEWTKMGVLFSSSGLFIHILLSPFFGCIYYFEHDKKQNNNNICN